MSSGIDGVLSDRFVKEHIDWSGMNSKLLTYWKTWLVDCSMVLDHVQWDVMSTCRHSSTQHPEHMMQRLQQHVCTHVQLGENFAVQAVCRQSRFHNQVLNKVCRSSDSESLITAIEGVVHQG